MDLYVFAGIGLFGFLFILISFVMGEVGHIGDFGGGVDHEVSVGDGSLEHDVHLGESGGEHDGAHGGDGSDGPGPFSLRVISIFMTTFGAAATAARISGARPLTSAVIGLASGYAVGWCVWRILRLLWSQGGSSELHARDLQGCIAEVTVAVPAAGPGQVACVVDEVRTHQIARSASGTAIPLGSRVRIMEVTPEGVLVEPAADQGVPGLDEASRRKHNA